MPEGPLTGKVVLVTGGGRVSAAPLPRVGQAGCGRRCERSRCRQGWLKQ